MSSILDQKVAQAKALNGTPPPNVLIPPEAHAPPVSQTQQAIPAGFEPNAAGNALRSMAPDGWMYVTGTDQLVQVPPPAVILPPAPTVTAPATAPLIPDARAASGDPVAVAEPASTEPVKGRRGRRPGSKNKPKGEPEAPAGAAEVATLPEDFDDDGFEDVLGLLRGQGVSQAEFFPDGGLAAVSFFEPRAGA